MFRFVAGVNLIMPWFHDNAANVLHSSLKSSYFMWRIEVKVLEKISCAIRCGLLSPLNVTLSLGTPQVMSACSIVCNGKAAIPLAVLCTCEMIIREIWSFSFESFYMAEAGVSSPIIIFHLVSHAFPCSLIFVQFRLTYCININWLLLDFAQYFHAFPQLYQFNSFKILESVFVSSWPTARKLGLINQTI